MFNNLAYSKSLYLSTETEVHGYKRNIFYRKRVELNLLKKLRLDLYEISYGKALYYSSDVEQNAA